MLYRQSSIYEVTVAKSGPKLKLTSAQPDEPSNETSTVCPAASGGIDYVLLPARNITLQHFAAVQLGLKIEATRGLIETLVIDHLDRPSDN